MLFLPACCRHIAATASLTALTLQAQISSTGAGTAQEPCCASLLPCQHAAFGCLLQAEERHSRCRLKTALQEQRSRWDLLAQAEQNFTVAESFTLGWFNVLLRHLWPTLIEKEVSDSVTKELRVRTPCCLLAAAHSALQVVVQHDAVLSVARSEKEASKYVNQELRQRALVAIWALCPQACFGSCLMQTWRLVLSLRLVDGGTAHERCFAKMLPRLWP